MRGRRRRKKTGAGSAGLRARQDCLPSGGKTTSFCLEKKTQEQSSRENRPDRQMDGGDRGKKR